VLATERHVRNWLEVFVVGLDLCPFARPVLTGDSLRICISEVVTPEDLRLVFLQELDLLQNTPEREIATTLLVCPACLADFDDYLEFLDDAQALVLAAGLEGLVQLASFHPNYQFEGESPESPGNFSNRSPYPIIHLLRENMLTRVLAEFPDPERIPERNIETLEGLGLESIESRWEKLFTP
jgi:hypothetical protein